MAKTVKCYFCYNVLNKEHDYTLVYVCNTNQVFK